MNEEVMNLQDQTAEELEVAEEAEKIEDPLFVCKTSIDINTQMEATKVAMGKTNLIANLVLYGMCFLMAASMIYDSIVNQDWQKNAFMLILVGGVVIFTLISRVRSPRKTMERWESAIMSKYGTKALHLTTEFYERSLAQILQEDEDQFLCEGYSSIYEMKETENLFMLRHAKNQYYFVAKKGFTKGTAEQFRSFMEQRIGGK